VVEYETQCFVGEKEVQRTRSYYAPVFSLNTVIEAYNNADVDEIFYIKISGRLEEGEVIDNILVLNDFVYDEYAWWNASFDYRRKINCSNMTDGVPLVINGSDGFKIGGYTQIVWTYCAGENTSVYYNSYSNYVVANDTAQLPMEVEKGNGTSYNPTSVWDSDYKYVGHFDNSAVDSTNTNNGTVSGATNQASYIGDGYYMGGDGDEVYWSDGTFDSVFESGNYTFSAWVRRDATGGMPSNSMFDHMKANTAYNAFWMNSAGDFCMFEYDDYLCADFDGAEDTWYYVVFAFDGTNGFIYIDGELNVTGTFVNLMAVANPYSLGKYDAGTDRNWYGDVDEARIIDANISLSEVNQSYQNMIGTSGFGDLGEEETKPFTPANESSGRAAIIAGVDASEVAGSYTAYTDKQAYIRLANGSQYKGTFDKYIAYSSGGTYKRWAFNYDENSSSGFPTFFNITPVFYFWQNYNMTYDQIKWNVSAYINNTFP